MTKQETTEMAKGLMCMAAFLMATCVVGCMTYIRTANLKDSPVHLEGIRGSVQAQAGVQTRGQHQPGREQATMQEGGGRADTQAEIPIQLDRSQSTSTPTPAASTATTQAVDTAVVPVTPPAITNTPAADTNSVYTITKVTANDIVWTGPCPPWADVNGAIGEVHLYHAQPNGRHEGKFDHFRKYNGTYSRDFKNIGGGYQGWQVPSSGEQMRLEMVSYDGKERIVVGTFLWANQ